MAQMAPPSPRSTDNSPEPEGGPRKRRRTAIACEECRERKRKCDGVKPVCGACTRRSSSVCSWNEDRNSKGWWSNSYVESLKARINELETAEGQNLPHGSLEQATPSSVLPAFSGHHPAHLPQVVESIAEGSMSQSASSYYATVHARPGATLESRTANFEPTTLALRPPVVFDAAAGTAPAPGLSEGNDSVSNSSGDESETEMDAMGVLGSVDGINRARTRRPSDYFGPSSTIGLLGKARRAMSKKRCHHGHSSSRGEEACQECQAASTSSPSRSLGSHGAASKAKDSTKAFGFVIPPRSEADSLVESYWVGCHSLYPFLHKPSFIDRYIELWNGKSESQKKSYYANLDGTGFYCMLNVVFALGALLNPDIDERTRESVSRSFFDRSKQLLDLDRLGHGSPALVQTLLLMGQYLQSTDMSSSCWNIVGLAIRVAQCIGLHHEPKQSRKMVDQVETEMRRRTWTGCVLLDRVLSLTYGRPLMIHPVMSRNQLVLPLAADDEYLTYHPDPPGKQPEGQISHIECYIQSIKLQEILGQVLASFYYGGESENDKKDLEASDSGPSGTVTPVRERGVKDSDLQRLLNVDKLLMSWHKDLPPHLRVDAYSDDGLPESRLTKCFRRQATVLKARYLHVRLMMLRPVLYTLCDLSGDSNDATESDSIEFIMRHGMLVRLANSCVNVARELVHLIAGNVHTHPDSLPPPWYSVFYIYSSALVLLISLLYSSKHIECADESALLADWKSSLDFLRMYRERHRSARRCSRMLAVLEQEISSHQQGASTESFTEQIALFPAEQVSFAGEFGTTGASSGQSVYSDDPNGLHLLEDFARLDQGGFPWMQNSTSDMTWLSLVPFLENMEDTNF